MRSASPHDTGAAQSNAAPPDVSQRNSSSATHYARRRLPKTTTSNSLQSTRSCSNNNPGSALHDSTVVKSQTPFWPQRWVNQETDAAGGKPASLPTAPADVFTLRLPANADKILSSTIDAQRRSLLAFELRETDAELERRVRRARLQMLVAQQTRREAWAAVDATHVRETHTMLEDVVRAVRDRQTGLHADGVQIFLFPNNDLYEGSWKNGYMHGKGCLRRESARDLYEGQWFVGQRCGDGVYHGADFGFFYHGAWLDDKMHGKGELLEAEGSYVGEFQENHIHGYGEYVYNDGHVYRGEWVRGLYEGSGVYLYPSGSRYEGRWQHGLEHGRGTQTFFNGDVYSGEWRCGLMHGYGSYSSAHLQVEGNWRYGELNGEVTCTFADGSVYTGECRGGRFDGVGTYLCGAQNSVQYTGSFANGKPHGHGVLTTPSVQYTGMWAGGQKEGAGVLAVRELGGDVYRSDTWHADELHGVALYRGARDDEDAGDVLELRAEGGVCTAIVERADYRGLDLRLPHATSPTRHDASYMHA